MSEVNTRDFGFEKESLALQYLEKQGLQLILRNFSCPLGEIDLVMQDSSTLVFVEVRYRGSTAFGGSAASISSTKQRHMTRTAAFYLKKYHRHKPPRCRFDVVAINGDKLNWIKNALLGFY
jgi:putative endonuclease